MKMEIQLTVLANRSISVIKEASFYLIASFNHQNRKFAMLANVETFMRLVPRQFAETY